jgi:hypothetical protein
MLLYETLMLIFAAVTCVSTVYASYLMHKSSKGTGNDRPRAKERGHSRSPRLTVSRQRPYAIHDKSAKRGCQVFFPFLENENVYWNAENV